MKGVYCLLIRVKKKTEIRVGALGPVMFARGLYAYVGSAQNGLAARLGRHFGTDKKARWHVDYLLASPAAMPRTALVAAAEKEAECRLAGMLGKIGRPVPGFGASDCSCASHLFLLPAKLGAGEIARQLGLRQEMRPGEDTIRGAGG